MEPIKGRKIPSSELGERTRKGSGSYCSDFSGERPRTMFGTALAAYKTDHDLLDKLFNVHRGLLSSLASKGWVARACGVIDQETYLALEAIRNLRNAFAHENFKISLSHPTVEEEIARLREYISPKWFGEKWEQTAPERFKQEGVLVNGSPHVYFLLAAMQVFTKLSLAEFDLRQRQ